MRYILTQHYTIEHKDLFDLTNQINKTYAEKMGFEYISNGDTLCPDRKPWWEKIAWLNKLLLELPDDSLVVYEDCDSLNLGGDMKHILDTGYEFGMVHLRGGLNSAEIKDWFNCGVIALINTPDVRDFLQRVWDRNDNTDEDSLNKEIQSRNKTIGNSKPVCSLDIEWNVWRNNEHLAKDIAIKSWHGMKYDEKLSSIKSYLNV